MIENVPIVKSVVELAVTVAGAIGKLLGRRPRRDVEAEIPKKTVIVPPNPNARSTWWHMGSSADRPAMQVVGRFKVTNITRGAVFLCAARMRKPRLFGHVSVKDSRSEYYGFYEVRPKGVTDLSFDFWIIPPVKKEGETFTADVAIIDQFGNQHWIKRINFIYT